jgi:acyl-CoA synthetase (AMP-forming)/AMP-acid ligase II
MTEAPMICVASPLDSDEELSETDGRPVFGLEVRLVDDGAEVAVGAEGNVEIRGATLFQGYTDPELTAAAFSADGWFSTGDRARFHPGGTLEVTGRIKDVIIRKGENISPLELESLLVQHPAVEEVAVIGLPDADRGELVCAALTVRLGQPAPSLAEITAFLVGAGIMKQKIPEHLEIVAEMPRSGIGKLSKPVLRQQIITKLADLKS